MLWVARAFPRAKLKYKIQKTVRFKSDFPVRKISTLTVAREASIHVEKDSFQEILSTTSINLNDNNDLLNQPKVDFAQPHTILIDCSPIIWRNYSQVAEKLTAPNGMPIHAVYGYIRTLLKIMKEYKYDYIGVCLDTPKSFRKELVPTYKSKRPPVPEDLACQIALVADATRALGILPIQCPGYEADDIIATYARKAEENGHRVTIISPDKDFGQVVTQNVVVVSTTSNKNRKTLDIEQVQKVWGVAPAQVPHVQAICGDSIDNIQSVPNIGPVRAAALIQKYGTVENLLDNRHTMEDKYKDLINRYAGIIESNLKLTKLVDDIKEIPLLNELKKKSPDRTIALNFLERYGMKSVISYLNENYFHNDLEIDSGLPDFPEIPITAETTPLELREMIHANLPGVTVVNDEESAQRVVEILKQYPNRYHAWDTETIDIDLNTQSPVGHGTIICASIYIGPDVNFGNGSRVWINNFQVSEGTINFFKEYLEDPKYLKVWHNYSFDRHIIHNHGIDARGFGGDTMHMARLWDASRTSGGYSLEALTQEVLEARGHKRSMKSRFGIHRIKKDGAPAKDITLPPLDQLQTQPSTILAWIDYSTLDAESTWFLREALEKKLHKIEWGPNESSMVDFYKEYWLPFGELLTDMERIGIMVNVDYLHALLPRAQADQKVEQDRFVAWAAKYCPDAKYMNPSSDLQKRQLLFAPVKNIKTGEVLDKDREFNVANVPGRPMTALDPEEEVPESESLLMGSDEDPAAVAQQTKQPRQKSTMSIKISGLGLKCQERTLSGWPAVNGPVLKRLAGDPPNYYGAAKDLFEEKGFDGKEACESLAALNKANTIDTLISTFIQPLPTLADSNQRIHCSLNLNTETGRLSARKPNLQNQPALEKDIYKIRKAFTCSPGNLLIVADYGQLELRLLAHMTKCKSMIEAFKSGGDFHSRTALGMYDYIKQEIDAGRVLLEWDSSQGKAPVPLLKDKYGTERRRAKVLNFSIAYGKTVHGLAKDWSVTEEEAQDTLNKWYSDRPEVRDWQSRMISYAKHTGCTRTLLGRYRPLPQINSTNKRFASHSERAAINTPLQGGAADVMVCAMVNLHRNQKLRSLGWRQLLQIHDELIFEGPMETAAEAKDEIVKIMENPLQRPLLVDLVVDAKIADTWYDAK
eukprot:TRINITY_DN4036_c0_g3_i1.p1 TRINITY_DN4036_c0_g3~~TRINITY_DN4036_c0_g3_i1.p1  ORF type:complete len:1154 (-),score=245.82 TRINITY_DN4036_c0_g3_i1:8-3469(-)